MINANPNKYRKMNDDDIELGNIKTDFYNLSNKDKAPRRVKTGYRFFDSEDSGFYGGLPQGLSVFGGRTGCGKTTLFWNLASNMSSDGTKVIYFSFEMNRRALLAKSICYKNDDDKENIIEYGKLLNGCFDNLLIPLIDKRLKQEWEKIKNIRIYYRNRNNERFNVDEITEICDKELGSNLGNKAVIMIDYLQLIAPPNDEIARTDKELINYNMSRLMQISDSFKVPVLCISSLNRKSYEGKYIKRNNDNPAYTYYEPLTLTSFKESGEIEYNSTCCFTLEPMQKEFGYTGIKLKTLKNRYGSLYKTVLQPDWENQIMKETRKAELY